MKIKILTIVLLLVFKSIALFSQNDEFVKVKDTSVYLDNLQESLMSVNTIQSLFTQTKYMDLFDDKIVSEGKLFYEKEDNIKWQYDQPVHYVIVMNGEKALIESEDKSRVLNMKTNPMMKAISDIIIGSIKGELLQDFDIFTMHYFENNKFLKIDITPKEENLEKILDKIVMYFSKTDMKLVRIDFEESTGDKTQIEFYNQIFNEEISADIFRID